MSLHGSDTISFSQMFKAQRGGCVSVLVTVGARCQPGPPRTPHPSQERRRAACSWSQGPAQRPAPHVPAAHQGSRAAPAAPTAPHQPPLQGWGIHGDPAQPFAEVKAKRHQRWHPSRAWGTSSRHRLIPMSHRDMKAQLLLKDSCGL